jgi:drug/metabolite transporter (DMT)-like permease
LYFLSFVRPLEFKITTLFDVLPVCSVFVAMAVVSRLCIDFVDVSILQLIKPSLLGFSLLSSALTTRESKASSHLLQTVIIAVGLFLCANSGVGISWWNITLGMASNFFVVFYLVSVKDTLSYVGNSEGVLLTHMSAMLVVMLAPTVYIAGEYKLLVAAEDIGDWDFYAHLVNNGTLGFLSQLSLVTLLKYADVHTACIFNTIKSCLHMILAFFIWHDPLTWQDGAGLVLILSGVCWYYYKRKREYYYL